MSRRRPAGADAGPRVRFLHTADWQLGMTRHFLDADAQPRYTGARIDAITRIGEVALEQGCEFVLVCGDVFESNAVSPRVIARSLEAMRSIPVPVYLLPGNHDPLDAASVYTSAAFRESVPAHVHVLTDPGVHPVRAGLVLVAAPWFSKRPLSDLVADALGAGSADLPADGTLRIVAGHGAVDRLDPDRGNVAAVALDPVERALADGRIHYLALGDRHSPTDVGATGRVWYSGTQEVTDFDERDPGQVLVVDVGPDDIRVDRHQVGHWTFRDLSVTLNGAADLAAFAGRLDQLPAKDRTVLRLTLTGTLTLGERAELDELLAGFGRVFAAVDVWDHRTDLAVVLDDAELTDLGVGGFAQEAVAELGVRAAGAGSDAQAARSALSLLYRLAGGRR